MPSSCAAANTASIKRPEQNANRECITRLSPETTKRGDASLGRLMVIASTSSTIFSRTRNSFTADTRTVSEPAAKRYRRC